MKRVIKVHRSGMVYILVSIVMGILAINGGNNFHYLASASLLGYMLASGIMGRGNICNARLRISFPEEIYADTPFPLTIEISNKNRYVPIFLIDVRVGSQTFFIPVVQAGSQETRSAVISFPYRGLHAIDEIELSSSFPFNLFTRYWPVRQPEAVVVFPKAISRRAGSAFSNREREDGKNKRKLDADSDIVGVRPYIEGDPIRQVHWKSSARTGKLNTRIYDSKDESGETMIDLDELLLLGKEYGLSLASCHLGDSIRSGLPVGMKSRDTVYAVSSLKIDKLSMLTELALYE